MYRFFLLHLLIALLVTLNGCAIGPNYQRPEIDTPQAYRFQIKEAKDVANTAWWEQFKDPVLTEYIQIALRENNDLLIASARVQEYEGQLGIATGKLFPQIGAMGSAERQKLTEEGYNTIQHSRRIYSQYQTAFTASWEIDLWGKLRRSREAAKADLLGTEDARRGVILSLVASTANAYIHLLDLDRQLEIAKTTTGMWQETYELFKLKLDGGVISLVELSQVESEYQAARASIPQLEKTIAEQENTLSLLLGRNPGPIKRGKTLDQLGLPPIPAGLPSALLEQRPDVLQAEQQLVAANARIGVAKAAYFPTISLTGDAGKSSIDFSKLFNGPAGMWSLAAQATTPIFAGGQIRAGVQVAEAQQLEALFNYRKAIQSAFSDVENALVEHTKLLEQLEAQAKQVEALRVYAEMSKLQYDEGYINYLQVLDAERSYFSAQLSYVQTKSGSIQAISNIYKAMGGGWIVKADKMAVAPAEISNKAKTASAAAETK